MPTKSDHPEPLRPYLAHGVEVTEVVGEEARGTCPFCGREEKFYINARTGQYSCKTCPHGEGDVGRGNAYTFVRRLHEESMAAMPPGLGEYKGIEAERRIEAAVLHEWGMCRSIINGDWLLPAYNFKGEISNLYRWTVVGNRRLLLPTTTFSIQWFGWQFWDPSKPNVYIAEGPWDGMVLRLALSKFRLMGGKLVGTVDPKQSLLSQVNVLAVPGCEQFNDAWAAALQGKHVALLYDSDHPTRHKRGDKAGQLRLHRDGSKMVAGYDGMKSATSLLLNYAATVLYLDWGPEGYDISLPDGYDLRDLFTGVTRRAGVRTPSSEDSEDYEDAEATSDSLEQVEAGA